jgi:hypothetical protein
VTTTSMPAPKLTGAYLQARQAQALRKAGRRSKPWSSKFSSLGTGGARRAGIRSATPDPALLPKGVSAPVSPGSSSAAEAAR